MFVFCSPRSRFRCSDEKSMTLFGLHVLSRCKFLKYLSTTFFYCNCYIIWQITNPPIFLNVLSLSFKQNPFRNKHKTEITFMMKTYVKYLLLWICWITMQNLWQNERKQSLKISEYNITDWRHSDSFLYTSCSIVMLLLLSAVIAYFYSTTVVALNNQYYFLPLVLESLLLQNYENVFRTIHTYVQGGAFSMSV